MERIQPDPKKPKSVKNIDYLEIETKWDLVIDKLEESGPEAAAKEYAKLYFGKET